MLLNNLLDATEVTVEPFAICEVENGAAMDLGAQAEPTIHYLLQGSAEIAFSQDRRLLLHPGTVAIIPAHWHQHMTAHWSEDARRHDIALVASGANSNCCRDLDPGWQHHLVLRETEDGPDEGSSDRPRTIMACSLLRASFCAGTGLFDYLDEPIIAQARPSDPLGWTLNRLLEELATPRPGSMASARVLLKESLILLLRGYCKDEDCRLPWLAALEDERLARSLQAMTNDPTASHNLESLAALAGMSRSSFAQRFSDAFGRGAIDLLIELRLKHAAQLLSGSNLPIERVARKVGYQSRSYFTRAFQARFLVSPGNYRRQRRRIA